MNEIPKIEGRSPKARGGGHSAEVRAIPLLTREELAGVLKVSLHTVDRMLADEDIGAVRVRGKLVRFYLPDVVRDLAASALARADWRRKSEIRSSKSETNPKAETRMLKPRINTDEHGWPLSPAGAGNPKSEIRNKSEGMEMSKIHRNAK